MDFFYDLVGRQYDPVMVIIMLEFLLSIYSLSLTFSNENKILKVLNAGFTVLWIVLAILNIIRY